MNQTPDDIFAAPTNSRAPLITSDDVAEKFSEKMRHLERQDRERDAKMRADELGVPYIDLKGFPISPETLILFSDAQSQALKAVCFFHGASDIRIGAVDPTNPELQALLPEIAKEKHANMSVYLISEQSFEFAYNLYRTIPRIRKFVSGVEITEEAIRSFEERVVTLKDLDKEIKSVSITDMVTLIIAASLKARSSDIHIEAEENGIKVRFRIDGLLHDVATIDGKLWPQVISRIKLIAKLKINVSGRPQDGRFTIYMSEDEVDVRVSCLPTAYGESVVMRLLTGASTGFTFESLGLRGKAYEVLKAEIQKPNGMIVTTGPTGSGKTTTLYATLNKLNNPETKIITIEDPVEYKLAGINQSQVDPSKNYTFATGLRSILRQDPDIVMVGEIRDLETAEIAINAALTGHLVVSTLHTNDAAGTIPRLLSMQVKPFSLAPAINAMIGQRLVRKICENCKKKVELDSSALSNVLRVLGTLPENSGVKLSKEQLAALTFYKGGGCEECQGIGFKGRIGIFEIMTMNKEVESLILSGQVSEYDMRTISIKHGMITMIQDGLLKAADGLTTVEEVFRVAKDITAEI